MTQGPVIVGGAKAKETTARVYPGTGWLAAQVLGAALSAAGLFDLLLAFYPPGFGNPQWLFGVLSAAIGGLAVLALGSVGGLLAAMVRGSRKGVFLFSAMNGVIALLLLLGLVAYVGVMSEARAALPVSAAREIGRVIVRTMMLGVLFLFLHSSAAVFGWKSASSLRNN